MLDEIDKLVAERGSTWPTRQHFIERVMPTHARRGTSESVALVDGAVLVNRPFAQAIGRAA